MIETIIALVLALSPAPVKPVKVQAAQAQVVMAQEPWRQQADVVNERMLVWERLAECEAKGEWDYNPGEATWGNKLFEGGLQFHPNTWDGFAPPGFPDAAYNASKEQQIQVGELVLAAQGWKAWPKCSLELGYR